MSCFIDMSIPYYEDNSILGRCNGFAKGSTKDKANRHSALITVISLHLALVDGTEELKIIVINEIEDEGICTSAGISWRPWG